MRAVIGPNGAGKTTMMDVITGKTRPDTGRSCSTARHRPDQARRAGDRRLGIGRKFQKPTVFEPHTVWDNLLLALAGRRGRVQPCSRSATAAETHAHRGDPADHAPDRQRDRLAGDSVARPEAVAGDRHAAGAGAQAAAGRRAGGRHDRRRDRTDRASCCAKSTGTRRRGGRARHGFRPRARCEGDGAARRLGAGRGLASIRSATIRTVIEVYLGR